MLPTRRWAALVGAAYFLAVYAVILDEPTPFVATCSLIAWLVVAQIKAVGAVRVIDRDPSAPISAESMLAFVGDHVVVTLTASLFKVVDASVEVELVAPLSVNASERACRVASLVPDETEGSVTCSVELLIAG